MSEAIDLEPPGRSRKFLLILGMLALVFTVIGLFGGDSSGSVTLHVSNQSPDDDPIRITVIIDGATVVDDLFFVEGQHTWVPFEVALAPGQHSLIAHSGTGTAFETTFITLQNEARWVSLQYWWYEGEEPRQFTSSTGTVPFVVY